MDDNNSMAETMEEDWLYDGLATQDLASADSETARILQDFLKDGAITASDFEDVELSALEELPMQVRSGGSLIRQECNRGLLWYEEELQETGSSLDAEGPEDLERVYEWRPATPTPAKGDILITVQKTKWQNLVQYALGALSDRDYSTREMVARIWPGKPEPSLNGRQDDLTFYVSATDKSVLEALFADMAGEDKLPRPCSNYDERREAVFQQLLMSKDHAGVPEDTGKLQGLVDIVSHGIPYAMLSNAQKHQHDKSIKERDERTEALVNDQQPFPLARDDVEQPE